QLIDITFKRLFAFGRAPQLEPQMLHWKAVSDRAAIVGRRRFGTRIARERDEIVLVDLLRDETARHRRPARRGDSRRSKHCHAGQKRQRDGEHDCRKSDKLRNLEGGATAHVPSPRATSKAQREPPYKDRIWTRSRRIDPPPSLWQVAGP